MMYGSLSSMRDFQSFVIFVEKLAIVTRSVMKDRAMRMKTTSIMDLG